MSKKDKEIKFLENEIKVLKKIIAGFEKESFVSIQVKVKK